MSDQIEGKWLLYNQVGSQHDCKKKNESNYIMQVTGNNASEAKFKCEKVIPHTPFTGDLNVSN